jgi:hypothetical protein
MDVGSRAHIGLWNITDNNIYTNCRWGIEITGGSWSKGYTFRRQFSSANNVYRNNRFDNMRDTAIKFTSCVPWSMFGLNIFENNLMDGAEIAIDYDGYQQHSEWGFPMPTATENQLFINTVTTNAATSINMGTAGAEIYLKNHTSDGINTGDTNGIVEL